MFFKKTCNLFLFTLLSLLTLQSTAQIEYGGEPFQWDKPDAVRSGVEWYTTEALDMDLIHAQDAVTDPMKDVPYRFGWEHEVDLNPANSGSWTDLPNGDRIWHLGIECPEATSISFIFDRFVLPKGARLYLWNNDRTAYKGAFTHKNNKEWHSLGVGLTYSDKVVIELYEPAGSAGLTELSLGTIVHGYRSILRAEDDVNRGPFGNSGACNINVNCPVASDWQIEKRSVALIVSGGFAQCTGALVNNTLQDGTPYFLTANHCLGGQNNWVFYFNHESAACSGSNGPTNNSVSGSLLRANRQNTDFALLELSSVPPANFNVQYSGWDNSDAQTVTSAVGIHHPSGDVKKICFEDNAPYHQNVFGAACWYINQWELGVTEGGSSGSPLFDQNHRIIGQLYGGSAACSGQVNNGGADWYGRFGMSWNGNSANQRLRDWLDPNNSGVAILDGFPDGFVAADYDAGLSNITNIASTICGSMAFPSVVITNHGTVTLTSATITATLNGSQVAIINWTGTLTQNQSQTVTLPGISVANGSNNLVVNVTNPNGQTDENPNNTNTTLQFTAVTGPTIEFTLNLILDDYGSETTWQVTNSNNQVLFSGGPYEDNLDGVLVSEMLCLPEGCYTFTIFDDWSDGICCGWGEGSWEIVSWNSLTLGSGGEFDDVESFGWCTDQVNVEEARSDNEMLLYPNPAGQAVTLRMAEGNRFVRVYDVTGRVVLEEGTNNAAQTVLNVAALSNGRYIVEVTGDRGIAREQLIIQR